MTRSTGTGAPGAAHRGGAVTFGATYRREWNDGFGARGWKLDDSLDDPRVIAVTAYTGPAVPTSVFVHDILDHRISGFGVSGVQNELCAIMQLVLRTGADARKSFDPIVGDLLKGRIEGGNDEAVLPGEWVAMSPPEAGSLAQRMAFLTARLGVDCVRLRLLIHFYDIGLHSIPDAITSWSRSGLDYTKRDGIGLSLQRLLELADVLLLKAPVEAAHGVFSMSNARCQLRLCAGRELDQVLEQAVPLRRATRRGIA